MYLLRCGKTHSHENNCHEVSFYTHRSLDASWQGKSCRVTWGNTRVSEEEEGDTWEKNFTMVSIELPWCSLVVQTVENMPTMQEPWLLYLGGWGARGDALEKGRVSRLRIS